MVGRRLAVPDARAEGRLEDEDDEGDARNGGDVQPGRHAGQEELDARSGSGRESSAGGCGDGAVVRCKTFCPRTWPRWIWYKTASQYGKKSGGGHGPARSRRVAVG